jgi:hypothetical protein
MSPAELVELAYRAQAVKRVLTNGLEHQETDLAVGDVAADEAPRHQRLQVGEEAGVVLGHGPRVLKRGPVGEDGERPVEITLALAEPLITPVDGRT